VSKGGSGNKTYYHTKDILYLSHEPLIKKFREFKIFMRKLKTANDKKELTTEKRLLEHRPVLKLDHIIKERYPTFMDAIRDLDDPLCMAVLFAQMPQAFKVKNHTVRQCARLVLEFQHYIINSRSLEKVFLSIKGIFYQATVMGQRITWLSPYKFSMGVPDDVDYRVMDTFLLFYNKLLGFTNYTLYSSLNLQYPPKILEDKEADDIGLNAIVLEGSEEKTEEEKMAEVAKTKGANVSKSQVKSLEKLIPEIEAKTNDDDEDMDDDDEEEDTESTKAGPESFPEQMTGGEDAVENMGEMAVVSREQEEFSKLFEGCWVFCSREVPRESIEFVVKSFGGKVSWAGVGSEESIGVGPFTETDSRITHHIVDRPSLANQHLGRHYVQPQWVYDSVNIRKMLPTASYTIGAVLPPHLSPFGEDGKDLNFTIPDPTNTDTALDSDDEEVDSGDETDEEALYRQELEEEAKGETATEEPKNVPKKKGKKAIQEAKEAEERQMAMNMMTKKQARLYSQIQFGKNKKDAEKAKLKQKRKANEKAEQEEDDEDVAPVKKTKRAKKKAQ